MTPGTTYWVTTLRDWAAAGYTRGVVNDLEVVLTNQAGNEIRFPRPSATWVDASLVVPALGPDADLETTADFKQLMKVGSARMDST